MGRRFVTAASRLLVIKKSPLRWNSEDFISIASTIKVGASGFRCGCRQRVQEYICLQGG